MTDTKKALAKALSWKLEAAYQAEILEDLGREPSLGRDIASDAYHDALAARRAILQHQWDLRTVERHVPHFGLTANVVAEAVNLRRVA